MSDMHQRTRMLIGNQALESLQRATVCVVGLGGVGSIAAEALARSGVGRLILVDNDLIDITNLNRQIQTHQNNVGLSKVQTMKKRILSINPDVEVICHEIFYDYKSNHIFDDVDFVIDAIDSIGSKMDLIEACLARDIEFICSTGMGNRLDPTLLTVMSLDKTSYDPLAKVMRRLARQRHIPMNKVKVVISSEQPQAPKQLVISDEKSLKKRRPPSSMFLVPPTAGLICAAECIKSLIIMYNDSKR